MNTIAVVPVSFSQGTGPANYSAGRNSVLNTRCQQPGDGSILFEYSQLKAVSCQTKERR